MGTKIEWCDESWNPIRTTSGGWWCQKSSPGCDHCWAERFNLRFGDKKLFIGLPPRLIVKEDSLHKLFHWKHARRLFVQDMGDLGLISHFHPSLFGRVVSTIGQSLGGPRAHTFIFLTKHPQDLHDGLAPWTETLREIGSHLEIGVTAENQECADYRIPELLKFREIAPSARLFVCIEPMLGEINIRRHRFDLDGVILGGETGPGARPMKPAWVRKVRDECIASGTPFFFKSWGAAIPSISDSIGDEKAMEMPKIDLMLSDFKRHLDGRTWDQLPGVRV